MRNKQGKSNCAHYLMAIILGYSMSTVAQQPVWIGFCTDINMSVASMHLAEEMELLLEKSPWIMVKDCTESKIFIRLTEESPTLVSAELILEDNAVHWQSQMPVGVKPDESLLHQIENVLLKKENPQEEIKTNPIKVEHADLSPQENPQPNVSDEKNEVTSASVEHSIDQMQLDALAGVEHWRFGFSGSLFDGMPRSIETDPYPGFEIAVSVPLLEWLSLRADFHVGFALLDTRQIAADFSKANRWTALVSARVTPIAYWKVAPGFDVGVGLSLMSLSNTRHLYESNDSVLPYLPQFSLLATGPELVLVYTTWRGLVQLQGYGAFLPLGGVWIEKAQKNVWPLTWDTTLSISYFVTPQIAVHVEIDHEGFWGVSPGNGTLVLNYLAMLMLGTSIQW